MGEPSRSLLGVLEAGRPEHPALVVPGGPRLTYRSLREEVWRGAEALARAGVRRGDRVALVYSNSAEAVVLFLAAALAGTAAPLNPSYKVDELRFFLEDAHAAALLAAPGQAAAAREALPEDAIVVEAALDEDGRLRLSPEAPAAGSSLEAPGPDDVALVLHTSGTTSRPKLVPLRHRHLVASVANIVPSYRLTPDDVSLCVMPLFHVHGLLASTLATFASGGTVVVPPRFSPFEFWALVREHRVTWYSAVPTIHGMLAGRGPQRPAEAASLRFARSCSSALPPALMAGLEGLLGVPVLEAYGMTEAAHQMASNPLPPGERRPGSVGLGTGVEIAVLDEAGTPLPAGQPGEVAVRGPNVMDGYEANPVANAEAFTGGWFRTGDQGDLDAAGYLRLLGRIKELINRGGEKIAPREVDEALLRHPAVAEAVTFGVPHEGWGEEVAAAVVLREPVPARELTEFCRRQLADYKVPRQLFVVDQIPRTATGKIQRRAVAAALTDR